MYNPTARLDKVKPKRIRIKRTKLLALMVCFVLVGTASALIYSNTLQGQFHLTATYPQDCYSNVLFGKLSLVGMLTLTAITALLTSNILLH